MIFEPEFALTYYGGYTYSDVQIMPVQKKQWFIERISKELQKGSDKGESTSRALHQNQPDIRALQGRAREVTPSRVRRFT